VLQLDTRGRDARDPRISLPTTASTSRTRLQPYPTWLSRRVPRLRRPEARWAGVDRGDEGIELDDEGYEVWFVHDKGFLHLQTTF
jgi:hypothetical protein